MKTLSFVIVCDRRELNRSTRPVAPWKATITLDGDYNNFAKDAIEHELYARGARIRISTGREDDPESGHIEYEDNRSSERYYQR